MEIKKITYLAVEGSAANWEEAIRLCGRHLIEHGCVDQAFVEGCVEREKEYPTGLPSDISVAIPHCRSGVVKENNICFLRLDKPVRFNRMDDDVETVDTRLIFNLAIQAADDHLEFLQKMMGFVTNNEILEKCLELPLEDIPAFFRQELG